MNETDIILKKLDSIENKVDAMGVELNKSIVQNSVQEEKINSLNREVVDIKEHDIPESVKAGTNKLKIWFLVVVIPTVIGLGFSVVNFIKG